jgi:hypothetical protein
MIGAVRVMSYVALCLAPFSWSLAQVDSTALRYANTITIDDLRRHLSILASDEYQGRDTGQEGQKMAAQYLTQQFSSFGIPPVPASDPAAIVQGYLQPFTLIEERSGSIRVATTGDTLGLLSGLLYFNEYLSTDRVVDHVVYLGKGNEWTGVKGLEGSVALMRSTGTATELMSTLRTQAEQAAKAGVEVLLVSTADMNGLVKEMGPLVHGSRMRLAYLPTKEKRVGMQVILVEETQLNTLLTGGNWAKAQRSKRGKRLGTAFTLLHRPLRQEVVSENVLAYIEGTDKKDELVVVTAHYDHVGVENGEVYNGADDDGSGTVALVEMAEAFAKARVEGNGPRRSVLIMPVSGEEKGLLGSRYYSDHPVFPMENTVADLNIDMIGRTDSAHAGGASYIYVIGSDRLSTDLHRINEEANSMYTKLELDYTFNAENDPNRFYYRSDHYNFARKGVPSIFYFSGIHEDYHQPGDDVEKIEFDRLHQRALLVFHTAWELANQEERIVVDKPLEPARP